NSTRLVSSLEGSRVYPQFGPYSHLTTTVKNYFALSSSFLELACISLPIGSQLALLGSNCVQQRQFSCFPVSNCLSAVIPRCYFSSKPVRFGQLFTRITTRILFPVYAYSHVRTDVTH